MTQDYFPIFLDTSKGEALVVGGGENAARKLRLLLKAKARVRLVAPHVTSEIETLAEAGSIVWQARAVSDADIERASLVVSTTGIDAIDRHVSETAQRAGIKVNVVDCQDLSDFIVPSIVDRSPVLIGISSAGAAPVLARRIRETLEATLPPGLGLVADFAQGLRAKVKATLSNGTDRRTFWERFFDGQATEAVLTGHTNKAAAEADRLIGEIAKVDEKRGRVVIVGAGPGAADLLTLRALRALQQADVIVHDALVGPDVLDLARRDAVRLYVGKQKGRHSHSQDRINGILIEEARKGSTVVRLKGGDPFIFGRGGEEIDALSAAGVDVDVVPGITAATGVAAALKLPLTHRDCASVLSFVTAHPAAGGNEPDFASLADPNQTAVVYMGKSRSADISAKLIDLGRSPSTPVAIVENATLPTQRILTGTLSTLPLLSDIKNVTGAALIVIGETVAHADLSDAEDLVAAVSAYGAYSEQRRSA